MPLHINGRLAVCSISFHLFFLYVISEFNLTTFSLFSAIAELLDNAVDEVSYESLYFTVSVSPRSSLE